MTDEPHKTRSQEKQEAREDDLRQLDHGLISREELSRNNGFLSGLNIVEIRIVNSRVRIKA